MITYFYINNTLVNPPVNQQELEIELKFREAIISGSTILQSTTPNNKWRFAGDEAQAINSIIGQGFIFEGIPFRIDIYHNNTTRTLFDGYIDCTEDFYTSCGEVFVTTKPVQGIDWLSDVAGGVSFEKMYADNPELFNQFFIYPPYSLDDPDSALQDIMAMISMFSMIIQIIDLIKSIFQSVSHGTGELPWASLAVMTAESAYAFILTRFLISQYQQLMLHTVQPVKYLCGMTYADMLAAGVQHLGLAGFEAPDFTDGHFKDVVRIAENYDPPKSNMLFDALQDGFKVDPSGNAAIDGVFSEIKDIADEALGWLLQPEILGIPNVGAEANLIGYTRPHADQRGFYNGNFADFLRELKILINGKIVMSDSILKVVRRDKLTQNALYQVPDLRQDFHGLNTEDFYANILVSFHTDQNESNTITRYTGTAFQVHHELKTVNNPMYSLLKGFKEVRIPLSLGKAKHGKTTSEVIGMKLARFMETMLNAGKKQIAFGINATWNWWVDAYQWFMDLYHQIVDAIVDFVIGVLQPVIDFLDGIVNEIESIINAIIDGLNPLTGGSLGHVDWSMEDLVREVLQVSVEIMLNSLLAPVFALFASDPHNLILMIMDLLGIKLPKLPLPGDIELTGYNEDRENMLVMENDFLRIPKLVKFVGVPPSSTSFASKQNLSKFIRVSPDNTSVVSARAIYEKFYCIDQFARVENNNDPLHPIQFNPEDIGKHNQYKKFKLEGVPFCFDDYELVKNDNIVTDPQGTIAELDTLRWNVYTQSATIEYRINKEYNINMNGENNLKLSTYEPNGQSIGAA